MKTHRILAGVYILSILSLISVNIYAAPKSTLWDKWSQNSPKNSKTIDHSQWSYFLNKYLVTNTPSGVNLVKYSSVTNIDKKKLGDYLTNLQEHKISDYNRNVQFAYWINLYNALTVKLIIDHYPVSSITKIKSGWFSFGPWDMKIAKIEGSQLTLNDIEHRILRPIWKDNRIHYALNCASISCPNLQSVAYTSKNTNSLLNPAVKAYIDSPHGVNFKNGKLILSSIYDWYKIDFAKDNQGLLKYLADNANKNLSDKLKNYKGSIQYDYNWNLNEYK